MLLLVVHMKRSFQLCVLQITDEDRVLNWQAPCPLLNCPSTAVELHGNQARLFFSSAWASTPTPHFGGNKSGWKTTIQDEKKLNCIGIVRRELQDQKQCTKRYILLTAHEKEMQPNFHFLLCLQFPPLKSQITFLIIWTVLCPFSNRKAQRTAEA